MCAEHGNTPNVRCDWLRVSADRDDIPVGACDLHGLEVAKVGSRCPCMLGGQQCELVFEFKK